MSVSRDRVSSRGLMGACSIEGCERSSRSRGWCHTHYIRWYRHGDNIVLPGRGGNKPGSENNFWKGDEVGYHGMHSRIHRSLGRAANYKCFSCPSQASQWSYNHLDPSERIEIEHGREYPFSTNVEFYRPLCLSCHVKFDKTNRREAL
jgi:hypothetical protein